MLSRSTRNLVGEAIIWSKGMTGGVGTLFYYLIFEQWNLSVETIQTRHIGSGCVEIVGFFALLIAHTWNILRPFDMVTGASYR